MIWLIDLALGAGAFLAAHAIEVYYWRDWFDPAGRQNPWFLNTGSAVAVTTGAIAAASALSSLLRARSRRQVGGQSLGMAAGAIMAMTATLFAVGPGNIFPVVVAVGAGLVTISAVLGGWLGFVAASSRRARLDRPEPP
jgi:ABC-type protease/lipase transport system fused ATPase/permease subunit